MKLNVKKTKSLRIGITEDEKVTLCNKNIDQVGSITYLGSIISKDDGRSEDVKSRLAEAQGVFSQLKKVWKNRKISLQTKIRINGSYNDDNGQIWHRSMGTLKRG